MAVTCTATKVDGNPCTRLSVLGTDVCNAHHPDAAEWRTRGGQNKSNVQRAYANTPANLAEVLPKLLDAFLETYEGTKDPKILTAMSAGASAMVKIHDHVLMQQEIKVAMEIAQEALRKRGR